MPIDYNQWLKQFYKQRMGPAPWAQKQQARRKYYQPQAGMMRVQRDQVGAYQPYDVGGEARDEEPPVGQKFPQEPLQFPGDWYNPAHDWESQLHPWLAGLQEQLQGALQQGLGYNVDVLGAAQDYAGQAGQGVQDWLANIGLGVGNQLRQTKSDVGGYLSQTGADLQNQFAQAYQQLASMPMNPFSDEMRQQMMTQIRDQVKMDADRQVESSKMASAARGLLNSTQALGQEQGIRNAAMQSLVGADLSTRQQQMQFNEQANLARQGLLQQLTGMQTPLTAQLGATGAGIFGGLGQTGAGIAGQLGAVGAQQLGGLGGIGARIGALGTIDPTLYQNITGDIASAQFGLGTAQEARDLMQQIMEQGQTNWGDILGAVAPALFQQFGPQYSQAAGTALPMLYDMFFTGG